MGDNISRQAVLEWLETEWDGMVTSVFDGVEQLPSTDRKGHWIDTYGDEWVCSNCGVATYASEDYHSDDVRAYKMNFCHYCGADMRGGGL